MCGRYVQSADAARLAEQFAALDQTGGAVRPSYNVAPTATVPVVLAHAGAEPGAAARELCLARWGLVPAWAEDVRVGLRMFNARVETVTEKPAFRAAVRARRCLVPADGYYEWQRCADGSRRPWYIHSPDGRSLALAGLYEPLNDSVTVTTGTPWSVTILTGAAPAGPDRLHERAPLLVGDEDWDAWLVGPNRTSGPGSADLTELLAALRPAVPGRLLAHRVDPRVGNVRVDSPALVAPLVGVKPC